MPPLLIFTLLKLLARITVVRWIYGSLVWGNGTTKWQAEIHNSIWRAESPGPWFSSCWHFWCQCTCILHSALTHSLQQCCRSTGTTLPESNEPPQSLLLQMAERLLRAQPDSVANHVTDRSISGRRALTWLATETGWDGSKHSAICSGKLISGYMISYDVNRRYGI